MGYPDPVCVRERERGRRERERETEGGDDGTEKQITNVDGFRSSAHDIVANETTTPVPSIATYLSFRHSLLCSIRP